VEYAKKVLVEWYGSNVKASADISRIVNVYHFNRLKKLLLDTTGKVVLGGDVDPTDLWISPTLVGMMNSAVECERISKRFRYKHINFINS
jgi:beta-apo-4'-carotenal oxygenase